MKAFKKLFSFLASIFRSNPEAFTPPEGKTIPIFEKPITVPEPVPEPVQTKPIIAPNIIAVPFPDEQYYKREYPKKQFVIHHSAGRDNPRAMYSYWEHNKARIATSKGIQDDGTIYSGFHSKYWAHHLGIKSKVFKGLNLPAQNEILNKHSYAVEICNWGALKYKNGKFYTWVNNYGESGKAVTLSEHKVVSYTPEYLRELGIKSGSVGGFNHFERYTQEEIKALEWLILDAHKTYDIPLDYQEDMWTLSKNALSGKPGIWTHISFRPDKSDCHPQQELIEMLQNLK